MDSRRLKCQKLQVHQHLHKGGHVQWRIPSKAVETQVMATPWKPQQLGAQWTSPRLAKKKWRHCLEVSFNSPFRFGNCAKTDCLCYRKGKIDLKNDRVKTIHNVIKGETKLNGRQWSMVSQLLQLYLAITVFE